MIRDYLGPNLDFIHQRRVGPPRHLKINQPQSGLPRLSRMCLRQQLSLDSCVFRFSDGKTQPTGLVSIDSAFQLSMSDSKPSDKATLRIELFVFGVSTLLSHPLPNGSELSLQKFPSQSEDLTGSHSNENGQLHLSHTKVSIDLNETILTYNPTIPTHNIEFCAPQL